MILYKKDIEKNELVVKPGVYLVFRGGVGVLDGQLPTGALLFVLEGHQVQ